LARSISLKRPRQYLFHMLFWQEFEELVRSLGLRLFGPSLGGFKRGPDGGRDARFQGIPQSWPSEQGQEDGQYVLQCKHTSKVGACCSDDDFKKDLRGEAKKVKVLIASKELSHYLVFTNRTKSAGEDEAFRKKFDTVKGLSKAWLIGGEHLQTLLSDHSDLWDRYEEDVKNPVRFNRDDLVKIIHDFADFVKQGNGQPRSESLKHLKLEDKNKLNEISTLYFSDLQRHSMPQFEQIRSFLENPRNEVALNLYRDTADDLRGQLRNMLTQNTVTKLEEGFDQVRDQFIASDEKLKTKRRWVRVFLDYMYSNCDIGQNVDATQTPKA
jgi:hypothetical protein